MKLKNSTQRWLALLAGFVIFAICAAVLTVILWLGFAFVSWSAPDHFPWTLLRILVAFAAFLAVCFALSEHAVD